MPALNFQPRFVQPIREGRKNHTIRAERKVPIKRGDTLYLYCGMRHPGAFRILEEPTICTEVQQIEIFNNGIAYDAADQAHHFTQGVEIDGQQLATDECEALAVADGFTNFRNMMSFWDGRLPFKGQIIHWKPQR